LQLLLLSAAIANVVIASVSMNPRCHCNYFHESSVAIAAGVTLTVAIATVTLVGKITKMSPK